MDIKAPLNRYPEVTGVAVDTGKIEESIRIIRNSGLNYIFRTTVVPRIHQEKDLLAIGEWLKGARVFSFNNFPLKRQS